MARREQIHVVLLTVPQHGLPKPSNNQRTPTPIFDGEQSIYESKELKELLSQLEKSNQGVTEQVSKQRKARLLPAQHCACVTKHRISVGRVHVPSIFREHFFPLLFMQDNKPLCSCSPGLTEIILLPEEQSFWFIFSASSMLGWLPVAKSKCLQVPRWKSQKNGPCKTLKDHSVPREVPVYLQEIALNTSKGSSHHFRASGSPTRRSQLLGHTGAGSQWTDNTLMLILVHMQNVSRATHININ